MQIIQTLMPDSYKLNLFSDLHDGSILCHHDGIEELKEDLLKPGTFGACGGDWVEAIATDDKRYDDTSRNLKPAKQRDEIIKIFTPVKHTLIGGLLGNHEWHLQRYLNIAEEICKGLEIPYGTYSAVFEMWDAHGLQWKLFYTHGRHQFVSNAKDPEQALANRKAALKMKMKRKAADCFVMAHAHCHQLFVVEPSDELFITFNQKPRQHYMKDDHMTLSDGSVYIPPDNRYYCATGSFLKMYAMGQSGYAEMWGLDPVQLGWIEVFVENRKVVAVKKREI
jgi:hypothetical protein